MREAMHHIRQKIYNAIDNITYSGSVVPVYNRVPTNATHPYIWIHSVSTNEVDQNASKYCLEVITRIEVITRFDGDQGGDLAANLIVSDVLSLLRTRASGYYDLSANNFSVYTNVLDGVTYEQIDRDDHTYFTGIIEMATRVEQTS
jgi:hypothetical protein|tara:strand:+ start:688 stop:1125 length:438 start_codon:yes stop_codon:yes gene_type:complete